MCLRRLLWTRRNVSAESRWLLLSRAAECAKGAVGTVGKPGSPALPASGTTSIMAAMTTGPAGPPAVPMAGQLAVDDVLELVVRDDNSPAPPTALVAS
jgi:hypothetical protein